MDILIRFDNEKNPNKISHLHIPFRWDILFREWTFCSVLRIFCFILKKWKPWWTVHRQISNSGVWHSSFRFRAPSLRAANIKLTPIWCGTPPRYYKIKETVKWYFIEWHRMYKWDILFRFWVFWFFLTEQNIHRKNVLSPLQL